MWVYAVLAALWLIIIFKWLIPVVRLRQVQEIYAAFAVGGLLSLVILGIGGVWSIYYLKPLKVIGFLLYIPSFYLVVSAFVSLAHKGNPESGWEDTKALASTGVFRFVRHPLYLGTALWSVGVVFVFPSVPSIIIGLIVIFCSLMASIKEDFYNIKKFGDEYREYMKRVPMWNFFKNLFKRKAR